MVWSDTCKCWVWGHRRGYMESSHPDQPGLATNPCADVIWTIPQIPTDQSVFFLSNTEQFPLSAVEKDRGEAPICSLHESPQTEKILCSSNSHRTATHNFWCFTLKRKKPQMNCQEASATSFPVGASSLQTLKRLAHTWRIYICMTPLSKRNTLQQQQKNRSLQAAEVLKSTDKTTAFTEFNLTGATSNHIQCEQLWFFWTNKTQPQTLSPNYSQFASPTYILGILWLSCWQWW